MKIYAVEYHTGYDYSKIIGYYMTEASAQKKADLLNEKEPWMRYFVNDYDVEE